MKLGIKVDFGPGFSLRSRSGLNRSLEGELDRFVEEVMTDFQTIASRRTPRRTGAAARAWTTQGSKAETAVVNPKPYIRQLDQGSSRQAPGGILKPTIKEIRRKYR